MNDSQLNRERKVQHQPEKDFNIIEEIKEMKVQMESL